MPKRKPTGMLDLFDELARQDELVQPLELCAHRYERKTLTVWPGETFDRCTWTCERCGKVRGRFGNEQNSKARVA